MLCCSCVSSLLDDVSHVFDSANLTGMAQQPGPPVQVPPGAVQVQQAEVIQPLPGFVSHEAYVSSRSDHCIGAEYRFTVPPGVNVRRLEVTLNATTHGDYPAGRASGNVWLWSIDPQQPLQPPRHVGSWQNIAALSNFGFKAFVEGYAHGAHPAVPVLPPLDYAHIRVPILPAAPAQYLPAGDYRFTLLHNDGNALIVHDVVVQEVL